MLHNKFLQFRKHSPRNLTERSLRNRAFSLIEIIVSLAIFGIVATIALGAYLKVMDANAKAQSLKTAINNLNFALDAMSREIRVGTRIQCGVIGSFPNLTLTTDLGKLTPNECLGGGQGIAFHSSKQIDCNGRSRNLVFAYRFNNGVLEKAEQRNCSSVSPAWSPMTSADLTITNPNFIVSRTGSANNEISRVLIFMGGEAGNSEKVKTVFNLQTTVAQRLGN